MLARDNYSVLYVNLMKNVFAYIDEQVVSQFYTNVFFFTNAVMFNALIDQGGDFALYQNTSGKALRYIMQTYIICICLHIQILYKWLLYGLHIMSIEV